MSACNDKKESVTTMPTLKFDPKKLPKKNQTTVAKWNAMNGFRKGRYKQAHAAELTAYRNAMDFLTQNRINPHLDPEKVSALIEQRKEKEGVLNSEIARLQERLRKLEEAEQELNRIQNPQREGQGKTQAQSR